MATIFISYRRDDAGADAGRLCDHLSAHFGEEHVFMDVDDISPGSNFVDELDRTLARADILLVLIGPQWLDAEAAGQRRLEDSNDFVRKEVERGLEAGIPIIPVLVRGAQMPSADQLPPALASLAHRQALEVSDTRFRVDVERLIGIIESSADVPPARRPLATRVGIALALLVMVGLLAFGLWREERGTVVQLRSEPAVLSTAAGNALITASNFYDARSNPAGRGIEPRYRTDVSGEAIVVFDGSTGLTWQKSGSGYWNRLDIVKAADYIADLNEQAYGGFSDWRLPTLPEAMSLMQPDKTNDFHIDPVFAAQEAPQMLTADRAPGDRVWVVFLYDGFCATESAGYNAWIRAVRGPG